MVSLKPLKGYWRESVTKNDDQRLITSLHEGRSEAFSEVVRSHYQAIFRFLVHLARDIHRAEDLVQETFGTAWERIASFQGRSSLETWLHRIAYTKFIDGQRTEQRAAKLRESMPASEISVEDPYQLALANDDARNLYRALDELSPANRTLLVLHYLQGLSYREIALVLNEPNGTIKWRMAEALKCLRPLVGKEVSNHAIQRTM